MASTSEVFAAGGELLRLSGISLEYGQITALKDINLELYPSMVHAIVGEHGAGKSSLGMIISGNVKPSAGTIDFAGRRLEALTSRTAHRLGIEMVYQHIPLDDYFSVAENIFFLNPQATHRGLLSRRDLIERTRTLLDRHGFALDPSTPVRNLNLPDRVLTSILAALQKSPRLLILDEALEKLSSLNLPKVLRVLDAMRAEGMAVLFITHRIDDVYEIADRVSIVKDGEILVTDEVDNIDKMNLLRLTYTQVYSREDAADVKREFNQYLKYNEAVLLKLPVNLLVLDAEERVKIVNEPCRAYFRLSGSVANRPLGTLLGTGNGEFLSLIRHALLSEEGEAFYHVPLSIGGIETVNNVRTLPINDVGRRIGNIIIIEDISEFDALQKQVILSEKLASVGLLAAGVAHEINNPLEILYNYLKYMKMTFEDPRVHESVDELHEEISYIAGIVRDLLSLSGAPREEPERIELNATVAGIIGLLRHSAREKRITISCSSPAEGEIAVTVNRNEIKQVILNLVKNSFEAMSDGGEITIRTRRETDDEGNPSAVIEFSDTGPGIRDPNPENVFMPFYSMGKRKDGNVGLGLSICYGIVKRHGGTIRVRNIEGGGCRFTVILPMDVRPHSAPV